MKCYVCLEECNNKSPCECGAYVHTECLEDIKKQNCTICKKKLDIDIESDDDDECFDNDDLYAIILFILCGFLFFIISGWIGKCFLVMFRPVDNFIYFWTPEHIVCSFVIMIIVALISKMFNFV
jgi:hypothetical protein